MPNFHVLCASSQDILTSRTSRPIPDLLAKTIASLDILVIVLPRSHSGRLSQATSTLVGLHSNLREPARGAQATCDNFGYAKGSFVSKRYRKPVKTATKRCCHGRKANEEQEQGYPDCKMEPPEKLRPTIRIKTRRVFVTTQTHSIHTVPYCRPFKTVRAVEPRDIARNRWQEM